MKDWPCIMDKSSSLHILVASICPLYLISNKLNWKMFYWCPISPRTWLAFPNYLRMMTLLLNSRNFAMLLKTRGRGTFYYKKCLRLQNGPGIVRYLQFRVNTNNLQLKLVFMLSIFSPESRVNKGLESKNCNTVALKKTEDPLDLLYKKLGHPQ